MPLAGEGKSRLRSVLSDEDCLDLQRSFLRRTVDVARDSHVGTVYVFVTPHVADPWFEHEIEPLARIVPQTSGDLGARMLAAMEQVANLGYGPIVLIGTDVPGLRAAHLQSAIKALERTDVCLGPTKDGGYYLVASARPEPALFAEVQWGTASVLETTLAHANKAGLKHEMLEEMYDVDTPEDLRGAERIASRIASRIARPARPMLPALLGTTGARA